MPKNPKRPCRYPGCPNLCERGTYCPEHSSESPDRLRGNATTVCAATPPDGAMTQNGAGHAGNFCKGIPCVQIACPKVF